ncbi:MAG: type II toxin-antitoxin system mRNA interferase toxin, RelE/StbE family [Sulfuriflexus sp.]|nr:type II toxin-antitoxin system mRNA interferase toxin, RelE/StbE family [Sulfuriflexus sp.]
MWDIYEHRKLSKQLKSLPINILKRYEKWKDILMVSGPQGLRPIKGFHDESLKGDWKGCRSSRMSDKYRVIYKVKASEIMVQVINLTAHDYRKK